MFMLFLLNIKFATLIHSESEVDRVSIMILYSLNFHLLMEITCNLITIFTTLRTDFLVVFLAFLIV